ncbi:Hypothetical predicted protein [Podarcis lilfordi]|uniref:Uncharacterized protein n=1 Tax=Podarcis lilfordi TaxID=74358 RepID=A0AA35KC29_9SAUR|nr:Hypothetical predicted protein [Podarcis lilfordi]
MRPGRCGEGGGGTKGWPRRRPSAQLLSPEPAGDAVPPFSYLGAQSDVCLSPSKANPGHSTLSSLASKEFLGQAKMKLADRRERLRKLPVDYGYNCQHSSADDDGNI